jgi:PAS domain S-box-containing protein
MKAFDKQGNQDLTEMFSLTAHTLYKEEKSKLVLQLNYAVWVIVVAYCFFYYYIGAITATKVVLFGALFLSPLTLFLEHKKFELVPRFLLIISCNFYIYLTGLSFRNEVNTEFYYLPATMLALLVLYEYEDKVMSYIGVFMPLCFWLIQIGFGHKYFDETWFAPEYDPALIKIFNFIGSFFISLVFVNLFRRSLYKLQNKMNKQNEEKQKALSQVIDLLAKNTKYMNQAQKVAQLGNWHFDLTSKRISWSEQMYRIFPEEMERGEPSYERHRSTIHPQDMAMWESTVQNCVVNGQKYTMRFRVLTRELNLEKFLWVEAHGEGEMNADGSVKAIFGTCQDITEQLNLEKSLIEQRQFLDIVLNNVPSMIFVKDFQKNLSFSLINKAGEDLLGVKKEDLIGKNDFNFFPKDQAEFFVKKDCEVFDQKSVLRIEQEEIATPKGIRFLQTQKVPTYDIDGKNQFLIGISSDITEEVMAQKVLAEERAKSLHQSKLATLGEMAAGMAHEINNPLAIIDGMVNLLPASANNYDKFHERINSIKKAIFRISTIVSGLKKFSRSSEGLHRAPVRISDVLAEVSHLTKAKIDRHQVEINLKIIQDAYIYCNEVELEQVFVNLINNAIDAIKELTPRWINIQVFSMKSQVMIHIIDSGPGISQEIREKIFNPFYTTKKVGEGTGLGLSISKGIIEAHQGSISLKSDMSNTCFEIILPLGEGQ